MTRCTPAALSVYWNVDNARLRSQEYLQTPPVRASPARRPGAQAARAFLFSTGFTFSSLDLPLVQRPTASYERGGACVNSRYGGVPRPTSAKGKQVNRRTTNLKAGTDASESSQFLASCPRNAHRTSLGRGCGCAPGCSFRASGSQISNSPLNQLVSFWHFVLYTSSEP